MVETYTAADKKAIGKCSMTIRSSAGSDNESFIAGKVTDIIFQFPPKVTADGKKTLWKARDKTRAAFEPIVTWDGADPRAITVEMTYVVSGTPWTAQRIMELAREFKRYHYGKIGAKATVHIIEMKLFDSIVGANGKFRIESTSIKYSPQLVTSGDVIWPKVTTITIACLHMSRVKVTDGIAKLDVKGLDDLPRPEWY